MDKFFDAMNVHNYIHGIHARKPFQMPNRTTEDMRLKVAKCRYDIIRHGPNVLQNLPIILFYTAYYFYLLFPFLITLFP